jgi:multidrug efflux pump subunit AcrA (membrane-fusion protein)
MARKRRLHLTRPRIIGVAVATVVLLGAGTGAVFASTASAGAGNYRTAVASIGSVTESLSVSGSIASATRRDLAFAVAGTVTSIPVQIGDTVQAGDPLATVDTTDLQSAVDDANSKVAQAQQTLSSDLASQTSTAASSSSSSKSSSSSSGGSSSSGPTPAVTHAIAAVTAAQQNLLTLVTAAEASLTASQAASAAATTTCAPFLAAVAPTDTSIGDGTDPAADVAAAIASNQAALAAVQALLTTCQTGIAGAGTAQTATDAAQAAVAAAMTTLDTAIADLQTALGAPTTTHTSTPTTSAPSSAGAGSSKSAADIVADKAAITAAQAQVTIAEQQLAAHVLSTPITGTVAAISMAVGDTVSANSTTAVISVIGTDGYVIDSTLSLSQIAKVKVGQKAQVTIASNGSTYDGSVAAVGITNVSTTSTPSYGVTISVDAAGATLLNGAAATANIAVSSGDKVLTVPISALHTSTRRDTVDVLADGKVTPTVVEVGSVGADAVEITKGLAAGDVVVIADLDAAIATTTSTTNSGLTGLTTGGRTGTFPGGAGGFRPPTG